jgi:hypothetical protein
MMRYMLLLKGDPDPSAISDSRSVAAMRTYLDDLVRAGVLLAADTLRPSSTGARLRFAGGGHIVSGGPFAAASELVAGYFLIEVRSMAEAIAWASRCPVDVALEAGAEANVEVRQVDELPDAR